MSGVPVKSPLAPSVLGRFKRAVRAAVDHCGHISGAAATCERRDQSVGEWNSTGTEAFPPVDCAFAMDEVAVARGARPEILHRYAAELGHVAIRLPEAGASGDALMTALAEASAEFGDVARELCEATRDGTVSERERARIVEQVDEAIEALVRMRRAVSDSPAVRLVGEGRG